MAVEYCVKGVLPYNLSGMFNYEELVAERMNQMAKEGWRVVCVTRYDGREYVTFVRES